MGEYFGGDIPEARILLGLGTTLEGNYLGADQWLTEHWFSSVELPNRTGWPNRLPVSLGRATPYSYILRSGGFFASSVLSGSVWQKSSPIVHWWGLDWWIFNLLEGYGFDHSVSIWIEIFENIMKYSLWSKKVAIWNWNFDYWQFVIILQAARLKRFLVSTLWSGGCTESEMLEAVTLGANKAVDLNVRLKSHLPWLRHIRFFSFLVHKDFGPGIQQSQTSQTESLLRPCMSCSRGTKMGNQDISMTMISRVLEMDPSAPSLPVIGLKWDWFLTAFVWLHSYRHPTTFLYFHQLNRGILLKWITCSFVWRNCHHKTQTRTTLSIAENLRTVIQSRVSKRKL